MPSFLKKFDAWLLLRYPRIWASRIHIFAFFSIIVCNLLLFAFAYLNKVSIERLPEDRTIETTVLLFAILSVLGVFYWFSQFKAKLKTFTYVESLLSFLMCFGVVTSLMINSQLFKATTIQRVGKLMPIEQSNKDLLLLNVLEACAAAQFEKIDSIENLKLYDIEIGKPALEKIINLSKEVNRIGVIGDSLAEIHGRDSITIDFLQQVIKGENFSEEAKAIFFQDNISAPFAYFNFYENKLDAFQHYIKNDLKHRYASATNADMSYKVRDIYKSQNLRWKGLIFNRNYGYYSSDFGNGGYFNDNDAKSVKLTQQRVDRLKSEIEMARFDTDSIWDYRNDNFIIILFLVFSLFLFFNSAWRDFIITIISFCIVFVIYVLGMEFSGSNFSRHVVHSTAILFTILYLILGIVFWLKLDIAIQKKRIFQIILLNAVPVCYFSMLAIIDNYSMKYAHDSGLIDEIPYIAILFYSLLVPMFITLYHRLSEMPKYK